MNQHKLSLESLLEGAPVVLPCELTYSMRPGYGKYESCDGEGPGVTLTLGRGEGPSRTEWVKHYPNRYHAWSVVQGLMGRVAS